LKTLKLGTPSPVAPLQRNRPAETTRGQPRWTLAEAADTGPLIPVARGENQLRNRVFPLTSAFLMAKTSWINRNDRKRKTVQKYAALRAELKAKKDYIGLSQLPRDASPTRVVNRCQVTGRRRAFIRRFKISRLTFRELASAGLIPGLTKSSW
jgi:small subunit ribosomal protein S14